MTSKMVEMFVLGIKGSFSTCNSLKCYLMKEQEKTEAEVQELIEASQAELEQEP